MEHSFAGKGNIFPPSIWRVKALHRLCCRVSENVRGAARVAVMYRNVPDITEITPGMTGARGAGMPARFCAFMFPCLPAAE